MSNGRTERGAIVAEATRNVESLRGKLRRHNLEPRACLVLPLFEEYLERRVGSVVANVTVPQAEARQRRQVVDRRHGSGRRVDDIGTAEPRLEVAELRGAAAAPWS